jgi:hypothetical protein
MRVRYQRDGSHWMASLPGFVNLQESVAAFGRTKLGATANLAHYRSGD